MKPDFEPFTGIYGSDLGARSPLAFVHAVFWSREGWESYSECGDRESATTDLRLLRDSYNADVLSRVLLDVPVPVPAVGFRVVADAASGLIALRVGNARDLEMLTKELGKLPTTRVVECGDNGPAYHIFQSPMAPPKFIYSSGIDGTAITVEQDFPLPGSLNRETGEVWRYRRGCDISQRLNFFPRDWLFAVPSCSSAGISATPDLREDNKYSTLTRSDL